MNSPSKTPNTMVNGSMAYENRDLGVSKDQRMDRTESHRMLSYGKLPHRRSSRRMGSHRGVV